MRYFFAASCLAVSVAASAPVIAAPFAHRTLALTPAWTASGTQALKPAAGVADLGLLAGSTPLHVGVGLDLPNKPAAYAALRAMYAPGNARYHHFLSPAQFTASFGPSPATADAVAAYLHSSGFTNVVIEPNRLFVTADGTAALANAAFNTSIHQFRTSDGHALYANVVAAQLPAQFAGLSTGVFGLNNVPLTTMHRYAPARTQAVVRRRSLAPRSGMQSSATDYCNGGTSVQGVCLLSGLTIGEMVNAYDGTGVAPGSAADVAIFTGGNLGTVVSDLRTFESVNALPQVPVSVVSIGTNPTDTSGDDEWDLDTQASTGFAGAPRHLYIYDPVQNDSWHATLAYNKFVTDDVAETASASYGSCELFNYLDGSLRADDLIFFQATFQGQSVFASTGDTGSSCYNPFVPLPVSPNGTPEGIQGAVAYPASSPFVVAVGGTSLLVNSADGSYNTEIGWAFGGGGMSALEVFTLYQSTPYSSYANRTIPDIALAADPYTAGLDVIVAGQHAAIGGTSLSSPAAMGIWARINGAHNNTLGSALPNLYGVYNANGGSGTTPPLPTGAGTTNLVGGFHDILVGNNQLYSCLPGYDLVTGLGTPDIRMLAALFHNA